MSWITIFYLAANASAFMATIAGAYKAFRKAPPGERWIGSGVIGCWMGVAILVPFIVGVSKGMGAGPSGEATFLLLTFLLAGVTLFGFAVWRRY